MERFQLIVDIIIFTRDSDIDYTRVDDYGGDTKNGVIAIVIIE